MKIKHFNHIPSTQNYLVDLIKSQESLRSENILISTNNQTNGRGRGDHIWDYQNGAIAFSFTLKPLKILTFTALEISCLVSQFFKNKIYLKWPNDLMDSNKNKIGGILINIVDQCAVVGVGLNLISQKNDQYPSLMLEETANFKQALPVEIYNFILNNRMSEENVPSYWENLCCHLNQTVQITEAQNEVHGIFIGLGPYGQAKIKNEKSEILEFINGSLQIQ